MSEYVTTIANGDMDYVASPSGELLLFFPKERIHDAVSVARILNEETKTLQAELATANAALAEQSAKLKQQEATIRELQERSNRFTEIVNQKEAEKVELRATVTHRDELLRIQSATCERYKRVLEQIETHLQLSIDVNSRYNDAYYVGRVDALNSVLVSVKEALQETHEPSASKEALSEGEITE